MTKFFMIAMTVLGMQLAQASNLPDLGSPDLVTYDSQTEQALGRAFSKELNTQYPMIQDPESLNYIREIGHKITRETGNNRNFKFYIIDDAEINAFAGPNGIIGIHSGLIMSADSEDELASIIAHEVAHVTQNHLSRTYSAQSNINITSIATLIAAILVGTQDPSAGIATYMGGMGLSIQEQLKNSRAHEHEADYFGIDYLAKAGYDPMAMSDFFGKLSKASQLYEFKVPELLLTHPVTETRLAQAQDRASQLPKTIKKPNSLNFELLKLRIHALSNQTKLSPEALSHLNTYEQCYLKNAVALNKKSDADINKNCLNAMPKEYRTEKLPVLILAQVNAILKDAKALTQFQYLSDLFPNDPSILLRKAQAIANLENKEKARQLIEDSVALFNDKTLLYNELADLYAQDEKPEKLAYSYYYGALANIEIGNLKNAKHLLEKAKTINKDYNSILRGKIETLLNEPFQDDEKTKEK